MHKRLTQTLKHHKTRCVIILGLRENNTRERNVVGNRDDASLAANVLEVAIGGARKDLAAMAAEKLDSASRRSRCGIGNGAGCGFSVTGRRHIGYHQRILYV